jgi:hypothetical protein
MGHSACRARDVARGGCGAADRKRARRALQLYATAGRRPEPTRIHTSRSTSKRAPNDMTDDLNHTALTRQRHVHSRFAMRWLALACATTLAQACKDTAAPVLSPVSGTVALDDAWANRLSDFSGVEVDISGLSQSTVTDASGAWHIDSVPGGLHDVTFKKPTFGTFSLTHQQLGSPSTAIPEITLASTPWQQAIIDSVYATKRGSTDYYVVDGHLSDLPPSNALAGETVVFIGKSASVSPDPASYQSFGNAVAVPAKSQQFSIALQAEPLRTTFGSGGKPYFAAYVTPPICDGCGARHAGDASVYVNTGPRANVVQVTIN